MIAATLLSAAAGVSAVEGCILDRSGTNMFTPDGGKAGMGGAVHEGGNEAGGSSAGGVGNEGGTGGNLPGGGGTGGMGLNGGGGTGLEGGGGTGGSGGAACVPTTEICDGIDNNCNNAVDEDDPALGAPCDTLNKGECAEGTKICDQVKGQLVCLQTNQPKTEVCSGGKDEDCDELIDCKDPSCTGDPACSSSVTVLGDECYKVVKFYKGTTTVDVAASTPNDNACFSGNKSGLYAPGDTAMAWQNDIGASTKFVFTSTIPPVSIQKKCAPTAGTPPNYSYSTMALQAGGYAAATVTVNGNTYTIYPIQGCIDSDLRITY